MNQPEHVRLNAYVEGLKSTRFFGGEDQHLSLDYMIRYYRERIPTRRTAFIAMAVTLIVAGAVNAFIAARGNSFMPAEVKDTLVTFISLGIGALGALNGVFRYEGAWNGFTAALFSLEHLKRRWEKAQVDARIMNDEEEAIRFLERTATAIEEEAHQVTTGEMQGFFQSRRLPEGAKPKL